MKHGDYEIEHFRPMHRPDTVRVLASLLGDDEEANGAYFDWKYQQNPHADEMLGIVALHRGRVVGFRGYASSLWHTPGGGTARVLVPGDTVVDSGHRNQGLSVAMGRLARSDYAARYALLLNLSCTRASLPGYLKLGFAPITAKVYLSAYRHAGLVRYLLQAKRAVPLADADIEFGQFGEISVSTQPVPAAMASVVAQQQHETGRLRLVQDAAYFGWRLSDPACRFVFYSLERQGEASAYLVLAVAPSNRRAYLVDYADDDGESAGRLLDFLAGRRDFDVLSVFRHSTDTRLRAALEKNRFHAGGIMGAVERKVRGNLPLLVRPVVAEPGERDWFVDGLDVRDPRSWSIKGISSDAS